MLRYIHIILHDPSQFSFSYGHNKLCSTPAHVEVCLLDGHTFVLGAFKQLDILSLIAHPLTPGGLLDGSLVALAPGMLSKIEGRIVCPCLHTVQG